MNALVGAVCGSGDIGAAVQSALNSGNCTCQNPPPLPDLNNNNNNNNLAEHTSRPQPPKTDPSPRPPGGPNDPIQIPSIGSFQLALRAKMAAARLAALPCPQLISVHKNDGGPTTAAGDVCAHVSIQLSQQLALTRNAFQGTLVIDDSDSNDLSSVLVALNITDDDNGNSANDVFGIQPPDLTGVDRR